MSRAAEPFILPLTSGPGGVTRAYARQSRWPSGRGPQTTTLYSCYPDNMIIIAGRAGDAYAPIYTCFADGSPIVVEPNPSQTGAGTIDINVTAIMDTKVVMASKAAFITGVN